MTPLERLARIPWFHYWEQQIIGIGFYGQVKRFLGAQGAFSLGKRVLDIGCGQGILAEWFPNDSYVGIDTDSESLGFARRRFHKNTFIRQDATGLSFQNETFDLVISIGILHHLSNEQVKHHLQEAFRVLKRGGAIIVFDSVKPEKGDYFRLWMSRYERGTYLRTPEELDQCLVRCGFSDSKFRSFKTWYSQNYSLVLKRP